jgi:phosphoesterase RecJ-like protein
MNYPESQEILEEIKNAKKILLNCHRGPDPDSVGSALSMYQVLKKLGKEEVKIICPSETPEEVKFLKDSALINRVDFTNFDFGSSDLFIVMDSGSWSMVSGKKDIVKPNMKFVVIDHHQTNTSFGEINLVDAERGSNCEVMYNLFEDWNVELDQRIAQTLLTGIIGDTGTFEYPNTTPSTFKAVSRLLELGADKDEIILNLYRSRTFEQIKMWGEYLKLMQIDKDNKFVWAAMPYEIFEKNNHIDVKSEVASMFMQNVKDTEFGIVMLEDVKNHLWISFRSRKDFDVSGLAELLGGGGHKGAAGGELKDLPFDKAVEKVLETAREYAKKT